MLRLEVSVSLPKLLGGLNSRSNQIIQHSNQLRQNAQIIDELDVLLSFAALASEMNFVRPVMMDK